MDFAKVPALCLSRIGAMLPPRDCCALASVVRMPVEARADVAVTLPPDARVLESFAAWLCKRTSTLESLSITTDINAWAAVWRYVDHPSAPRLRHARLVHAQSAWPTPGAPTPAFCGPEELLPAAPGLDALEVEAPLHLSLGRGFSRLKSVRSLSIICPGLCLSEPTAWHFPGLTDLYISSGTTFTARSQALRGVTGAQMMRTLRRVECPAAVLPVLLQMHWLEELVLVGSLPPETVVLMALVPIHAPTMTGLRSVRLVSGCWPALHWLPPTLRSLEVIGCPFVEFTVHHLERLALFGTPVSAELAASIGRCTLDEFILHPLGAPCAPMHVTASTIDVSAPELDHVTWSLP